MEQGEIKLSKKLSFTANFICGMVLPGKTCAFDSADEAVEAAVVSGAKYAIPIHFGQYEGTMEDAKRFEKKLKEKGITAEIKDKQ